MLSRITLASVLMLFVTACSGLRAGGFVEMGTNKNPGSSSSVEVCQGAECNRHKILP